MVNNRVQKLRKSLASNNIDAILISQADNRYYLSGFSGSSGFLLITDKKAVLGTDFRYTEQALAQAPDYEILRITNSITDWLPELIKDLSVKKAGFEAEDLTFEMHRMLKSSLKKKGVPAELIPVKGIAERLREVKESEEIVLIQKAVEISDIAYEKIAIPSSRG